MPKFFNKKTAILFLLAAILFSSVPKTTHATLEVQDIGMQLMTSDILVNSNIIAAATGIGSASTVANTTQGFFEWSFKAAGEALKRQLLNMIVDQIVRWIQGGGDPKFITDWPGFFRDAVDQTAGHFLDNFNSKYGVNLCSPFKALLGAGFIPIPTFSTRSACTLSKVGANLDAFLKDFRSGGWVAWQEMVLRPQNNVYGAYLMAWDQYEIEKSAAAKAAAAEAQAGRGFLSVKGGCLERNYEGYQQCLASGLSAEECDAASCNKRGIVTPGAFVGDMAAKAGGSDIDYIVNANDFAAYVGAIVNALLNRVFAEGVGLLHSAFSTSASTSGGGGGGASSAQYQCAQLLGTAAYNNCINAIQSGADIREFQKNNLIATIEQDLAYQNQLLGAKQSTLFILNQSIGILNQLKDCQASTSPALAAGTASTILSVQSAVSNISDQIPKIQSDIIALQTKEQEIKAITDVTQIPSVWAKVAGVINPAATYSLVLAAQNEASQKQQAMSSYQQQLTLCSSATPAP
ncbi:hypothetical protein HY838_00750 [Candidatus Azambacteria bacterium]|nr:hypothetical protein [Candidatus Azambacteria bacterium]